MKYLDYLKIRFRLFALGAFEFAMPLDIFSISNQIKGLYPHEGAQKIIDFHKEDSSAFVRRAILVAIHNVGGEFGKRNVGVLRDGLNDEDAWVCYEAIWALSDFGAISEYDRVRISEFAKRYESLESEEIEKVKPLSSEEHRDKMAVEALMKASA